MYVRRVEAEGAGIDEDYLGRPRALRWVAHDLGVTKFGVDGLEQARGWQKFERAREPVSERMTV